MVQQNNSNTMHLLTIDIRGKSELLLTPHRTHTQCINDVLRNVLIGLRNNSHHRVHYTLSRAETTVFTYTYNGKVIYNLHLT